MSYHPCVIPPMKKFWISVGETYNIGYNNTLYVHSTLPLVESGFKRIDPLLTLVVCRYQSLGNNDKRRCIVWLLSVYVVDTVSIWTYGSNRLRFHKTTNQPSNLYIAYHPVKDNADMYTSLVMNIVSSLKNFYLLFFDEYTRLGSWPV